MGIDIAPTRAKEQTKTRIQMKKILLLLTFAASMFAFTIDYDGFEADFVQTVKNKSGKKIEYFGKLKAKKPDKGVWEYLKPVKKNSFCKRRFGDSI